MANDANLLAWFEKYDPEFWFKLCKNKLFTRPKERSFFYNLGKLSRKGEVPTEAQLAWAKNIVERIDSGEIIRDEKGKLNDKKKSRSSDNTNTMKRASRHDSKILNQKNLKYLGLSAQRFREYCDVCSESHRAEEIITKLLELHKNYFIPPSQLRDLIAREYSPGEIDAFLEARQNLVGDRSHMSPLELAKIYEKFDGSGVSADSIEAMVNHVRNEVRRETAEDIIVRLAEAASNPIVRTLDEAVALLSEETETRD